MPLELFSRPATLEIHFKDSMSGILYFSMKGIRAAKSDSIVEALETFYDARYGPHASESENEEGWEYSHDTWQIDSSRSLGLTRNKFDSLNSYIGWGL